jgi:hypothetical protein
LANDVEEIIKFLVSLHDLCLPATPAPLPAVPVLTLSSIAMIIANKRKENK